MSCSGSVPKAGANACFGYAGALTTQETGKRSRADLRDCSMRLASGGYDRNSRCKRPEEVAIPDAGSRGNVGDVAHDRSESHAARGGSAIVLDGDQPGPGLLTERDVLAAVGQGLEPDRELVGDHLTSDLVFAAPDWSLEQAASAMVRGRFRHLIVVEGGELVGVLSMRDIVRCWTGDGAACEVPASAAATG
jgi:hypothetical protein